MVDKKNVVKAVSEVLESSKGKRKFKQTVELAINLTGVDLSIPKNRMNALITSTKVNLFNGSQSLFVPQSSLRIAHRPA